MYSNLENILGDIKAALNTKLYYPALAVALTLPDVCVALTFDKNIYVKEKHYVGFLEKYAPSTLPAKVCYKLRGGVIHSGNASRHEHFDWSHVIFTIPGSPLKIHSITIADQDGKKALMLDITLFCDAMEKAVRIWMDEHIHHPNVIRNLPHLLSLQPLGVSPFVVGMPVVACEA